MASFSSQASGDAVRDHEHTPQMHVEERDITELYTPQDGDIVADLVFVHGLQGHPLRTWQYPKDGDKPLKGMKKAMSKLGIGSKKETTQPKQPVIYWPADFIKEDYKNLRILTYGYDSHVSHWFQGPTNKLSLSQHGEALLNRVSGERASSKATGRPIIFVAHNLGGLLVKEGLIEAKKQTYNPIKQDIYESTKSIIFFATPHKGSRDADWGSILKSIASALVDVNPRLIETLRPDSEKLSNLTKDFQDMLDSHKLKVCSLLESAGKLGLPIFNGMVVPESSASFGSRTYEHIDYLDGNHMEICRFKSRPGNYARFKTALDFSLSNIPTPTKTFADSKTGGSSIALSNWQTVQAHEGDEKSKKQKLRLLSSLKYDNMTTRQDSLDGTQTHHNTFAWLWQTKPVPSPFLTWAQSTDPLFWIQGKPGSGKSTLINYIKGHDRTLSLLNHSNSHSWKIIYFFFDFRAKKTSANNFHGLLRSLIYQLTLSIPTLSSVFHKAGMQDCFREDGYNWSLKRLQRALLQGLDNCTDNICIFVDGLDELEGNIDDHLDMIQLFKDIANRTTFERSIKICLGSRPEPLFRLAFRDTSNLKMQDYNLSGIQEYVAWRLRTVALFNTNTTGSTSKIEALFKSIANRSDGVFIWARFAVGKLIYGLSRGLNLEELEKCLENLPSDLEELYIRILQRIKEQNPDFKETSILIQLTCWAQRPLRIKELFAALAFEMQKSDPTKYSANSMEIENFRERIIAKTGGFLEVLEVKNNLEYGGMSRAVLVAMEGRHQVLQKAKLASSEGLDGQLKSSRRKDYEIRLIHKTVATFFDREKSRKELRVGHEDIPLPHALMFKVCAQYLHRIAGQDTTLHPYRTSLLLLTAKLRQTEKKDMARTVYYPCLSKGDLSTPVIKDIIRLNKYRSLCLDRLHWFAIYAGTFLFMHAFNYEMINNESSFNTLYPFLSTEVLDLHNFIATVSGSRSCTECMRMSRTLNWIIQVYIGSSVSIFGALIGHGLHLHVKDVVLNRRRYVNETDGQPLLYAMKMSPDRLLPLSASHRLKTTNEFIGNKSAHTVGYWRPWLGGSFLERTHGISRYAPKSMERYIESHNLGLIQFLLENGANLKYHHIKFGFERCSDEVGSLISKISKITNTEQRQERVPIPGTIAEIS